MATGTKTTLDRLEAKLIELRLYSRVLLARVQAGPDPDRWPALRELQQLAADLDAEYAEREFSTADLIDEWAARGPLAEQPAARLLVAMEQVATLIEDHPDRDPRGHLTLIQGGLNGDEALDAC